MENEQQKTTPDKEIAKDSISKLLKFQQLVSIIHKDSINPFFKSKYFDVNTVIDTIKPVLNSVGLVITQPIQVNEGKNVLTTQVWDGTQIVLRSEMLLPEITDVQKFGAILTYLRRYMLVSTLLLQGEEDDDGNSASAPTSPNRASNEDWQGAPKSVRPATDKQKGFIRGLLEQKGVDRKEPKIVEKLEKLTSSDASAWIEKLNGMPDKELDIPSIQIDRGDMPE